MGAVKEEGRLKVEEEDSLSETLRVLETATGLGGPNMKCPQIKKNITQNKELSVQAQKWIREKKKTSGELMRDQNSDRKLVMLLFEDSGAEGEEIIDWSKCCK